MFTIQSISNNLRTIFSLIFSLILSSHLNGQTPENQTIILKPDLKDGLAVKMSEFFSEISYIQLETNPECLIGYMNIPVFEKEIIIRSHNNSDIYRFSNQGEFLNRIGRRGNGPGEYKDNTSVKLIGKTVYVVSNFSNDIICYSLKGDFIKKYHINIDGRPKDIVQLKDKSFMIALSNQSNLGNIVLTDSAFNVKTGFINDLPLNSNPLPFGFQETNNSTFYYYNYIDTIYDISNGHPTPSIIVNYGNHKLSNNKILNSPSILDFYASDKFLFMNVYYPFDKEIYTVLYRYSDTKQFTWSRLINDIDNGTFDRWSGFLVDDSLIFWLMPTTIIERLKKMSNSEKNDPINSRFVEMASKISLESNPVIMVCKLK